MTPTNDAPIGVFDSGLGGLSVLRHARARLPGENFLYVADSGHAPYGERSADWIRERSLTLGEFLIDQGAKALLIACNTATAAAAHALRERWPDVPVIGMEPAVKPAAAATRSGVVGILATTGTLASARFAALLDTFGRDVRVITRPGTGLVEAVERGELDTLATQALIASHVEPLLADGADVIVLGCTHYPFLRKWVEQQAGPSVRVIDTGDSVARQLAHRLNDAGLLRSANATGTESFWSSAASDTAERVLQRLWQPDARLAPLPA
ncbi:glutamate racemase [Methyloversatilis sp.]|uniref:glutamate racemase n=1 Tax=Methyloversatilis sp. TaxID=2569862 RepID=UPI00273709CB|nr:glutamate racemase [Methyloversatilis sp.]MDP2868549.1 glutamate racemase [Methyloversatilis sp.]MDP3454077.1 glutamate racemase [Methyloversatilis sp.]MDP3578243.1 glutamate racemase [Methyloversatilis sp.]